MPTLLCATAFAFEVQGFSFALGAAGEVPIVAYGHGGFLSQSAVGAVSPAVAWELDLGWPHVGLFLDIETMPTLVYLVSENGCCDVLIAGAGGAYVAGHRWEVGAYAVGGFIEEGAGLRVAVQPFAWKPLGFEVRTFGIVPDSMGAALLVRFTQSFGDR